MEQQNKQNRNWMVLTVLFTILCSLFTNRTAAQSIGYLSYDSALVSMPQHVIVEKKMADLQKAYDAELKRAEDEFNQKYEAFLDGRKDFPRTIMLKRQTELQQLLQRNVDFKQQAQGELQEAQEQAMAPLRKQLNEAIATVARRHGLAVVVNTDSNACPFIDPQIAVDISHEVQQELTIDH